jgi:hypothetical protein
MKFESAYSFTFYGRRIATGDTFFGERLGSSLTRYSEISSYIFMPDVPVIMIYMISKSGCDLGDTFFATLGEFRIL